MLVLQICIEGRPIASKIGAKSQFWSVEGEAVKVEDLALQHYAAEEQGAWQGKPCLTFVSAAAASTAVLAKSELPTSAVASRQQLLPSSYVTMGGLCQGRPAECRAFIHMVEEIPGQGRPEGCQRMPAATHLLCGLEGVA